METLAEMAPTGFVFLGTSVRRVVKRSGFTRAFLMVCGLVAMSAAGAQGQVTVPEGFATSVIGLGIDDGRDLTATPDGRILVAEGSGGIRIIENDQLLARPAIQIAVDSSNEYGLQNIALDDNFEQNGHVYAVFTKPDGSSNRVSRFTMTGNTIDPASERVIFDLPQLNGFSSHLGAAIVDHGDGTLLVSVGDHTRQVNGQDTNTREGSILRISKDGSTPASNPFRGSQSVDDAIYAYGLRNPWKMTVSTAGIVAVSDVGGSSWEEINFIEAGQNYGWAAAEGPGGVGEDPFFAYRHIGQDPGAVFDGCAIAGSTFYEPDVVQLPSRFVGQLFTADFCNGWIAAVDPETGDAEEFATGFSRTVDIVTNPANGALYVLDRQLAGGSVGVSKIEFVGADQTLRITSQPTTQQLAIGQSASFFVTATGQGNLTYQWERDGVAIRGATSPLLEVDSVRPTDSGAQFRVVVRDDVDVVSSSIVELVVGDNHTPEPIISAPAVGSRYTAGDEITIVGSAADVEDGELSEAQLTWEVRFNHDDHDHGFSGEISGTSELTITIPNAGETSGNVWYTIYLTAVDSEGATTTTTRRVDPRRAELTLRTSPEGGVLNFDGPPISTPITTQTVHRLERVVSAPIVQTFNGQAHGFVSWSDGGALEHSVSPMTATALTAAYDPLPFGSPDAGPACFVIETEGRFVVTFSGDLGSSVNLLRGSQWIQNVTGFDVFTDEFGRNSSYTIRVRDGATRTDVACTEVAWPLDTSAPPSPPPEPEPEPEPEPAIGVDLTCTGNIVGDSINFTFRNNTGNSSNLLGDGIWIANITGDTSFTHTPIRDAYTLRTRTIGVINDIPCAINNTPPAPPPAPEPAPQPEPEPAPEPALAPGGDLVCTGNIVGDGINLTFTDNTGNSSNLLGDGIWIANVTGDTTFTHTPILDSYTVRTRPNGVINDIPCIINNSPPTPEPAPEPAPGGDPVCTGNIVGDSINLTFNNNTGNSSNLLGDGSWIANVTGDTSFTHTPVLDSYTLRTRPNGIINDIACLLYTSPSPRDATLSRMPSSA